MNIGGKYNWKHSPQDQLVYIGKKGAWHQFRKIGDPREVWCEVLDEDLHMIEETKPHNASDNRTTEAGQRTGGGEDNSAAGVGPVDWIVGGCVSMINRFLSWMSRGVPASRLDKWMGVGPGWGPTLLALGFALNLGPFLRLIPWMKEWIRILGWAQ